MATKQANVKDLMSDISIKKRELMIMRVKLSHGEKIDTKKVRTLRKDIARIFTTINSKNN